MTIDGAPWSSIDNGRQITPNKVGRMLSGFGITASGARTDVPPPGRRYVLSDFTEVFERYVVTPPSTFPENAEQRHNRIDTGDIAEHDAEQCGTPAQHEMGECAAISGTVPHSVPEKTEETSGCAGVPHSTEGYTGVYTLEDVKPLLLQAIEQIGEDEVRKLLTLFGPDPAAGKTASKLSNIPQDQYPRLRDTLNMALLNGIATGELK